MILIMFSTEGGTSLVIGPGLLIECNQELFI